MFEIRKVSRIVKIHILSFMTPTLYARILGLVYISLRMSKKGMWQTK